MKSVDLDYMRKIQNCLPFADEGAGIQETQQAIGEMIAELGELRKQLADLRGDRDTLAGEVNELRAVDAVRTEINKGDPGAVGVVILRGKLMTAFMKAATARKKTDASGALTRAGKDHP